MQLNDISRQQFSKIASRGFAGQMTLTGQGLVLGAGTLLAKLDGKALSTVAEQERIWTLLSVAYGHKVPLAVLGSLRRVAKHWQGGDKSLSAIHCSGVCYGKFLQLVQILEQGETLDQERLGGWPRGVLENEMKRGWIVLLAAIFIAPGAIVLAFLPTIYVLVMFAMEPAGRGCDEGPVTDQSATNAWGDVVKEYIRARTGFGTVVDYSIEECPKVR
ncbi:MAG: hypothetical protein WAM29_18090 [Methylocella sp.]